MRLAEVASFAKKLRHGAAQSGQKAKNEVASGAKTKALRAFFGPGVRLQSSLCAPILPLCDATFLEMTRLISYNMRTGVTL